MAIHRVKFPAVIIDAEEESTYHQPLPNPTSDLLCRDNIARLLSTFTSPHTFEFECGDGCSDEYRSQLLSVIRDVLQDRRSLQLKDVTTLDSGKFSKLEIVRQA